MTCRRLLVVGGVALLAGCAPGADAPPAGRVTIAWRADDTIVGEGRWEGPVEAGWCDSTRTLALLGFRADTGVALRVVGSPRATGTVPLLPATAVDSTARGTLGLRWIHQARLLALKSDSGTLRVAAVEPTLSGEFDGWLSSVGDAWPTRVRGRFAAVPVQAGEAGCRLAHGGQSPRSGVP